MIDVFDPGFVGFVLVLLGWKVGRTLDKVVASSVPTSQRIPKTYMRSVFKEFPPGYVPDPPLPDLTQLENKALSDLRREVRRLVPENRQDNLRWNSDTAPNLSPTEMSALVDAQMGLSPFQSGQTEEQEK